jgi:hypothetical protein
LVVDDLMADPPQSLGSGLPRRGRPFEIVDEPVQPEELTLGGSGLGDAVGVEHDPVSGLEPLLADHALALAEPEQDPAALRELLDHLAVAHEERSGMTGIEVAEPT